MSRFHRSTQHRSQLLNGLLARDILESGLCKLLGEITIHFFVRGLLDVTNIFVEGGPRRYRRGGVKSVSSPVTRYKPSGGPWVIHLVATSVSSKAMTSGNNHGFPENP